MTSKALKAPSASYALHKDCVATQVQSNLIRICREYDILGLYLFGSRGEQIAARVRGEHASFDQPDADSTSAST